MSFFDKLFGAGDTQPVMVVAPAPLLKPFHVEALEKLDELSVFVKKCGGDVSPVVFSRLRELDDVLRPLVKFLGEHETVMENRVVVLKIITEYVPDPLQLFLGLPVVERVAGSRGELLLIEQYDILVKNTREIASEITEQAFNELATQTIFIKDRFELGV